MEYFDLYDKNGKQLDKTMLRGTTNNAGEYHIVVHVWIRNSNGQYLIQQRNKSTDTIPYQWGTTCGAVQAGETSLEGAIRETKEEIGVALKPHQFKYLKRYIIDDDRANYLTDLYLVEEDVLLNQCKIDTVEVRAIDYQSMATIQQMILDEQFGDYERLLEREGYFELLETS